MQNPSKPTISRRQLLAAGAAASVALPGIVLAQDEKAAPAKQAIVTPPMGKQILLSVKLGMITKKIGD
ncbi:MAG: hypothetical protein ACI9MB_002899, partial [Verrucomicrobiales bacterium]